jgi:hypothetical protein
MIQNWSVCMHVFPTVSLSEDVLIAVRANRTFGLGFFEPTRLT